MKRKLGRRKRAILHSAITASFCAAATVCGSASAAVTLYGLMDVGIDYNSNEGHGSSLKLSSGEVQQSRFGLLGSEDLGGGLQAVFKLENGFSANNGALASTGVLWSREARVGLVSQSAGSLQMGLQPASMVDYLGKYNAAMLVYGPGYYSAHPGNYDRVLNFPVANSVKYTTPSLGGFTASAQYGFGGQPGSLSALSTWSVGMGYDRGPISIGAGYLRANGPNVVTQTLAPAANAFTSAIPGDSLDTFGIGASYAFDRSLVHALYTRAKFRAADNIAHTYEIGLLLSVTPFLSWGSDFAHTDVSGTGSHINTVSSSVVYALSKRTDVYSTAAYEHVSGTSITGGALVAQLFSQGASSGKSQCVVRIALRHKF